MKEMSGHKTLDIILKNKDSCTFYDINIWRDQYNIDHPDVYVNITRDEMLSIPGYFYYFDYKNNIFYKQIHLKYPIYDDGHTKYPENDRYKKLEKYYKIQKLHERAIGKGETVE